MTDANSLVPRGFRDAAETPLDAAEADDAAPPAPPPEVGDVVQDWILDEQLGVGVFGVTYRARRRDRAGPDVVVKVAARPGEVAAAARQKRLLDRSAHPCLQPIIALAPHAAHPFVVLEHVRGRSLERTAPLPWREALAIGRDVAAALRALHAAGLVHGNIKASNVVVAADGRAVLVDSGLVRGAPTAGGAAGEATRAALAPEVRAGEGTSPASDVWAAGALLFELLEGERPRGAWRPPAEARRLGAPAALEALLARALDPFPGRRPLDGAALADALDALAAEVREAPVDVAGAAAPRPGASAKRLEDRLAAAHRALAAVPALWSELRADGSLRVGQTPRVDRSGAFAALIVGAAALAFFLTMHGLPVLQRVGLGLVVLAGVTCLYLAEYALGFVVARVNESLVISPDGAVAGRALGRAWVADLERVKLDAAAGALSLSWRDGRTLRLPGGRIASSDGADLARTFAELGGPSVRVEVS